MHNEGTRRHATFAASGCGSMMHTEAFVSSISLTITRTRAERSDLALTLSRERAIPLTLPLGACRVIAQDLVD